MVRVRVRLWVRVYFICLYPKKLVELLNVATNNFSGLQRSDWLSKLLFESCFFARSHFVFLKNFNCERNVYTMFLRQTLTASWTLSLAEISGGLYF